MRNNVKVLIHLMHFNWKWDILDMGSVIKLFGDFSVTEQWTTYIGNNLDNTKISKQFELKLNGRICSKIYRRWSYVMQKCIQLAKKYERLQNDSMHTQSGILAALFYCGQLFRFVFYVMFKRKFTVINGKCALIEEAIKKARLGAWILCQCVPALV